MAKHQAAISFSDLKELSNEVMDGTDVYIRVDGELFKAVKAEVEDDVTEDAVIVITVED